MSADKCPTCKGTGTADGALGFNGQGPCPKCKPDRWGPYVRHGEWYRLAPTPENCPKCSRPWFQEYGRYGCGTTIGPDGPIHPELCELIAKTSRLHRRVEELEGLRTFMRLSDSPSEGVRVFVPLSRFNPESETLGDSMPRKEEL